MKVAKDVSVPRIRQYLLFTGSKFSLLTRNIACFLRNKQTFFMWSLLPCFRLSQSIIKRNVTILTIKDRFSEENVFVSTYIVFKRFCFYYGPSSVFSGCVFKVNAKFPIIPILLTTQLFHVLLKPFKNIFHPYLVRRYNYYPGQLGLLFK